MNTDKIDDAVLAMVVFPKNIRENISVEGAALRDNYKVCDKTNDGKETTIYGSSCWIFFDICFLAAVVLCWVSEHLRLFVGDELDGMVRSVRGW